MMRRLFAILATLALLAPAAQGLPDLLRLLQPQQCYMDCAHDGGPCCCETFGSPPPPVAAHHGPANSGVPDAALSRPRGDRCNTGGRAVLSGRDWNLLRPRILEHRPPQPPAAWMPWQPVSLTLEPAPFSPSRPRAPPRCS